MRSYNGAIQQYVLHIWVARKMLMHIFPHMVIAPSRKTFVDAVPVSVAFWQQSPLRSASHNPHHCLDEFATVGFFSCVSPWMVL